MWVVRPGLLCSPDGPGLAVITNHHQSYSLAYVTNLKSLSCGVYLQLSLCFILFSVDGTQPPVPQARALHWATSSSILHGTLSQLHGWRLPRPSLWFMFLSGCCVLSPPGPFPCAFASLPSENRQSLDQKDPTSSVGLGLAKSLSINMVPREAQEVLCSKDITCKCLKNYKKCAQILDYIMLNLNKITVWYSHRLAEPLLYGWKFINITKLIT